jgi:acetyltransferase-like isoleucine patch superfamily enzyme
MKEGLFDRLMFHWRIKTSAVLVGIIRTKLLRFQGASIGDRTTVPRLKITWPHQLQLGAGCNIEDDVFFKFDGIWCPGPSIIVGDGVFIGRGCEFNIRKKITVGHGSAIASGCKFIDHDHGITGERIDETPGTEAEIVIGDYVWLGCNVVVLKGVTIGSSAVVGAGAVVTKNVPAGEIWAGVPARKVGERFR